MNGMVIVKKQDGVAHVILNRPDALSAVKVDMARALRDAMVAVAQDAAVRAVLIRASGKFLPWAVMSVSPVKPLRQMPARATVLSAA